MIQFLMGLVIATLYILILLYERRKQSSVYEILAYVFLALIIESLGVFLQTTFSQMLSIPLVYYEYITYIGRAFAPTLTLIFALFYEDPKQSLKVVIWLFFVPVFILISVWTNPIHNLFFVDYTNNIFGLLYYIYFSFVIFTTFFDILTGYDYIKSLGITYLELIPAFLIIIRSSIDKSKLLSPQTILLIITCVLAFIPRIIVTITGTVLPIYIMPITYMCMSMLISLNILKYNVLNAVPIALKSVIDIMSDAFVVISPNGDMVDMNRSFISKFSVIMNLKHNKNIFDVVKYEDITDMKKLNEQILEAQDKGEVILEEYHIIKKDYDRYFEVQIQPIRARTTNGYIATLLVFKDITEQKSNIDIVIKRENLSVIGAFAGGVAHDINTPITAIKSGLLMLSQTVKTEDEKHLIENMNNSADKISNLVNSLKNQIRNLGSKSDTEFCLNELIQDLYVIMHSELVKNNVKININSIEEIWMTGNTAKLTQALNNIIENSVEAYNKKGGIVDIKIYRDTANNIVIMIEDWAGGIPDKIKPYIFKRIVSANDMPATGVGLYLAYSVIKGSFGGDITFDTKEGRGTKFYITLPSN